MKLMKDWELARRDVLKGLGVGIACLPLIHTRRAEAAMPGKNKFFICILTSEGYRQNDWKPQTGPLMGQTLPFSTAPLEPVKEHVIVLPDLGNGNFVPPGGGGGHGSYGTIFWGLDPGHISYKEPTGKTLDQVVAFGLPASATGRRTLPLMVQLNRSPQSEPSKLGSSHCFFLAKGQPINPIGDPYATYMEIFGGAQPGTSGQDDPAVQKLMVKRKSILDYVGRNLEAFKARLGADDRKSVEAHHQGVRDLEMQLQSAGQIGKCGGAAGMMIDLNDGMKYPDILDAQFNLMVSALKCGVTNVATLQLSDSSGNNINFAFVPGIPAKGTGYKTAFRNYHDVGHNPVLGGVDHKRIVDKWMMEQFAKLITMMKGIPDASGNGTMLDNSTILFGNHMQDGSNHIAGKIPWLLAGKGGGYFKTGQCADSTGKQLNGVMTDICQSFGVQSPFGPTWAGIAA